MHCLWTSSSVCLCVFTSIVQFSIGEQVETTTTDFGIFRNVFLGEFCRSSEQCRRTVIDSECSATRNICTCQKGFTGRGKAWCEYEDKEKALRLPTEVQVFACESTSECDGRETQTPCKVNYKRHYEGTASHHVEIGKTGRFCDRQVFLNFTSDILRFGEAITVNVQCYIYVSGSKNFSTGLIKVQDPEGLSMELRTHECFSGHTPCTRFNFPCEDTCPERNKVADYMFGIRPECQPIGNWGLSSSSSFSLLILPLIAFLKM